MASRGGQPGNKNGVAQKPWTRALERHVQQNPDSQKTIAQEYFDKLKIEPVAYKLVPEADPDPRKPVPAEQNIPTEGLMRDARAAAKARGQERQESA